ncbi:hypothetical protein HPP92_024733 [Vanilla planifolia]|uniref:Uncharacterized protein n=1 Tax=Vanilla planifolia TaxID=51239 RepID=A0A835U8C8_VANPL|nr:hypothetical protein HPP92_024733 [Vanilla planifolia]
MVTIGGHVFKGFLDDKAFAGRGDLSGNSPITDVNNSAIPNISSHLGAVEVLGAGRSQRRFFFLRRAPYRHIRRCLCWRWLFGGAPYEIPFEGIVENVYVGRKGVEGLWDFGHQIRPKASFFYLSNPVDISFNIPARHRGKRHKVTREVKVENEAMEIAMMETEHIMPKENEGETLVLS